MCIVEHRVLRVVLDGLELAGHGVAELLLHEVVEQSLDDGERYLVESLVHVLIVAFPFHALQRFGRIGLEEESSAASAAEEVLVELVVGRDEHDCHVLLLGDLVAGLILVPSRVERESVCHAVSVRVVGGVGARIVTQWPVGMRVEVSLLEHGVHLVSVQQTVAVGQSRIVERCRETVEHMAEELSAAVGSQHLRHVLWCDEHFVELVDISVLAHDVAFNHFAVVDVGVVLVAVHTHDD